jgi:hypothetical protein
MLRGLPSRVPGALTAACLLLCAACARPASRFSVENAQAHVRVLAGTIGTRPTGSDANRRAREYIVERLRAYGYDVRVQDADAERRGTTAHVANIIATRPGRRGQAIALVSHYDSVPDGPGAADDGLGVAVCLEAGRVLAQRERPNYAVALIFTDGEELGLMGAAAIVKDPIMGWVRAVLNFEAVGSSGPNVLFETSQGSGRVLEAWARSGSPAGASCMEAIYKVLPNDTDFTLFRRARVPGINFGATGDSYSYHTTRDTTARLDPALVRQAGENALATVETLDEAEDLSDRTAAQKIYFDVLGTWAVTYDGRTALILLGAALLAALFGWLTVLPAARAAAGLGRLLLTIVWTLVGVAAVSGAMLGAVWLLRATRETYQPWYAHPDRLVAYLALAGILGGWTMVRIGRLLPQGARGSTHPAVVWAIAVPFWLALAVAAQVFVAPAAYLAVIPLLAAGVSLIVSPFRRVIGIRIGSAIVLAVAGTLWIRYAVLLFHFIVATFGRLPIVTPFYAYPALLLFYALFLAPPMLALAGGGNWQVPWQNRLLLAAFVFAAAWCWFAPAYTDERPLHGSICYVNDLDAGRARWQIASNEPGIHVGVTGPVAGGWQPGAPPGSLGIPIHLSLGPFEHYGATNVAEAPPLTVTGVLTREGDGAFIQISAVPHQPALGVVFRMPAWVMPEETNLAGTEQDGSVFTARYLALPPGGVTFRARISSSDAEKLESGALNARAGVLAIANGLPGAAWPKLPGWLRQEHVAWHARSYFFIPVRLTSARAQ